MSSHHAHRLVAPRFVEDGISPDVAEYLLSIGAQHLGSAVHTIERVSFGKTIDPDNWTVVALISTGAVCAVVEQRMDVGVLRPHTCEIFRSTEVKLIIEEDDQEVFAVLHLPPSRETSIQLPRGTKASDVMTLK